MKTYNLKNALEFLQRYRNAAAHETAAQNLKNVARISSASRPGEWLREPASALDSIRRYTIAGITVVLVLDMRRWRLGKDNGNIRRADCARDRRR